MEEKRNPDAREWEEEYSRFREVVEKLREKVRELKERWRA